MPKLVKNLSLRRRKPLVPRKKNKRFYQSRAARDAERTLRKIDRASVKAVSLVSDKIDRDGVLEAYEGVEAAREIRNLFTKIFADLNRNSTFRRIASSR